MSARSEAFRWPKGLSGNPDGQSRYYHVCHKLARETGSEMMRVLIGLALDPAADERVRSVCALAVLDRAGVRSIDKPEEEKGGKQRFDPGASSLEELAAIEYPIRLLKAERGRASTRPSPRSFRPDDESDGTRSS
jgi:hypothetical protein